jgi:hypothetical protein
MNNTTKIALLAVMLTTLIAGTQAVSADDHSQEFDREAHKQIHEQVHAALEVGDYQAFKEATADSPRADITEDQFNTLIEAHELREAGNHEGAKALLDEAGIERPKHKDRGQHKGPKNEEARAALEAGDYQAFQEATADGPRANITEDQFNVLIEAHELREAGDNEGAKSLLEEAGFERPERPRKGNFQAQE